MNVLVFLVQSMKSTYKNQRSFARRKIDRERERQTQRSMKSKLAVPVSHFFKNKCKLEVRFSDSKFRSPGSSSGATSTTRHVPKLVNRNRFGFAVAFLISGLLIESLTRSRAHRNPNRGHTLSLWLRAWLPFSEVEVHHRGSGKAD